MEGGFMPNRLARKGQRPDIPQRDRWGFPLDFGNGQ
jgi:hypothetical protein